LLFDFREASPLVQPRLPAGNLASLDLRESCRSTMVLLNSEGMPGGGIGLRKHISTDARKFFFPPKWETWCSIALTFALRARFSDASFGSVNNRG